MPECTYYCSKKFKDTFPSLRTNFLEILERINFEDDDDFERQTLLSKHFFVKIMDKGGVCRLIFV